jgi:hypothetical protein
MSSEKFTFHSSHFPAVTDKEILEYRVTKTLNFVNYELAFQEIVGNISL